LIIINALKIIFLLGFLIFIHEGGHCFVAKKCGVIVEEFAIGFGPKLFGKEKNGTYYSIRAVPLGGFCKMLGEERREEKKGSFSEATPLRKA
jgi:regulator of sigma E protease